MAGWGDGLWGEQGWGGFTAFTSSVDEASTGADAVVSALAVNPVVSETSTAADEVVAGQIYFPDVVETATGTDVIEGSPQYDVEIVEAHHRFKKDAPSGTALMIGKKIADVKGIDFEKNAV
jgi:hypothetical protein